jgi:hypothetical protein
MSPLAQKATSTKAAPPQPPKPTRVSMNPDSFTAGGLINDIDITISDAQTTTWDMNGVVSPDTPFLAVEMTDGNGTAHVQYYSAGKPEDWAPEDSGEGFVSPSGKTGINGTTNLGMFLASLVESGFPKELFDDGNLKVIIGTHAHVLQKQLERQGLIRTGKNAARPSSVLLVSKIHALPGADNATASAAKPASTGKTTTAKPAATTPATHTTVGKPNGKATPVAGDDLDGNIITALQLHLAEAGEAIPAKDNGMDALANKAVARASKQELRSALNDSGFVYDGQTLALAE